MVVRETREAGSGRVAGDARDQISCGMNEMPNTLRYTPLEKIKIARPVDRVSYISRICQNKKVLDLGAMDETAFLAKQRTAAWLHGEIARVAERVVGVDSSDEIPANGLATGPRSVIMRGSVLKLDFLFKKIDMVPDVVVGGELIEHLENPLAFLNHLRSVPNLRGCKLVLSTPNATAIHNVGIGMVKRESTHHDHLFIFSFKTLNTLLTRAGYQTWQITPYHSDFAEMKERNRGLQRRTIIVGENMIKIFETVFPMLSFGYIVETTC